MNGEKILHVLTDRGFVCGRATNGGYYFIEDVIEHGMEYVQRASAMYYSDIAMCTVCWNKEVLGIYLLRKI